VEHPEQIAMQLVQAGLPPVSLTVVEEDLESYFLRMVGVKGEVP
jgi:ABC-2 type transport system ATP-binding protein